MTIITNTITPELRAYPLWKTAMASRIAVLWQEERALRAIALEIYHTAQTHLQSGKTLLDVRK